MNDGYDIETSMLGSMFVLPP